MAYNNGSSDRIARFHLSKRIIGFVIACALCLLVRFNAGNEGQLRKSYSPLSKQAEKSAASASAGNKQLDVIVTTPLSNISSPAPFPDLPPPDNEEYMAICMAGEYLISPLQRPI